MYTQLRKKYSYFIVYMYILYVYIYLYMYTLYLRCDYGFIDTAAVSLRDIVFLSTD